MAFACGIMSHLLGNMQLERQQIACALWLPHSISLRWRRSARDSGDRHHQAHRGDSRLSDSSLLRFRHWHLCQWDHLLADVHRYSLQKGNPSFIWLTYLWFLYQYFCLRSSRKENTIWNITFKIVLFKQFLSLVVMIVYCCLWLSNESSVCYVTNM